MTARRFAPPRRSDPPRRAQPAAGNLRHASLLHDAARTRKRYLSDQRRGRRRTLQRHTRPSRSARGQTGRGMKRADRERLVGELQSRALGELEPALASRTAILQSHVGDGERELIAHWRATITIEATLCPDRETLHTGVPQTRRRLAYPGRPSRSAARPRPPRRRRATRARRGLRRTDRTRRRCP